MRSKTGSTLGIFAAVSGLAIMLLGSGCDRGETAERFRKERAERKNHPAASSSSKSATSFSPGAASEPEWKRPAGKKEKNSESSGSAGNPVERVDVADSPAMKAADRLLEIFKATEKAAGRLQEDDLSETENSTGAAE